MNYKELFLSKISEGTIKVGIIGLGYVGLPLALEFAENNISVLGFDLDDEKVNKLNNKETYIKHIPSARIANSVENGYFRATTDFSRLPEADALIICVPTPLNQHREPDLSFIESTAKTIQKYFRKGQLVTLESTTYPGTTEEILLPLFEEAPVQQAKVKMALLPEGEEFTGKDTYLNSLPEKFVVGQDFFLAYSPEREDPNNPEFNTKTIPKVIGGVTENCLEVARSLYDQVIVKTVPVTSPRVAEATKIVENVYRSINIALVNELKMVFQKMDIDVWEVIDAASTKPFGFKAFYPGPGLGGHCIPIDPFYLTWKAREYEINTKFIELAGEINTFQPYYVVQRAMEVLNENKKALKGSNILILGVAYKKNVDDMRESPSLKLIEILREHGATVDYNDPYIPKLPPTRKYKYNMRSVELTKDNIARYDLILLSTNHDDYDYEFIHSNAQLILDTRNAFKQKGLVNGKIYKA